MTEDTTPKRIPFEEHPLYPLYKEDSEQWNRFMKRYLKEDQIAEISERNSTIARDFKLRSTLTKEEEDIFNGYITKNSASEESSIFYPLDFENYIFSNQFNFNDYIFPFRTSFAHAKFECNIDFKNTAFLKLANFNESVFENSVNFSNAQFLDGANFKGAKFLSSANFEEASFSGSANFCPTEPKYVKDYAHTVSSENENFKGMGFSYIINIMKTSIFGNSELTPTYSTTYSKRATNYTESYVDTVFSGKANFKGVKFLKKVKFENVTFKKEASFSNVEFKDISSFREVSFKEEVLFSNAEFKDATDFSNAKFELYVPKFYGAQLHQDTGFASIWPDASRIKIDYPLSSNQAAYSQLVLEMSKRQDYEQRLDFFAKQLETKRHFHCRRLELSAWFLNYFYFFASDYGRSVWRPVRLVLLLFIVSFISNFINYFDDVISKSSNFETVLRYTFLDFLPGGPLLQQRAVNALFKEAELCPPHILLDIWNSGISVIILAGFFLLGLGLRNRFRIR